MPENFLGSRAASLALAFFVLVLGSLSLHAAVEVLRIDPHQTDPAIQTVHGPHISVVDREAIPRHRLLLFLVGTGAKATDSLELDTAFAKWGYHAEIGRASCRERV